jgi:hypothetical protein
MEEIRCVPINQLCGMMDSISEFQRNSEWAFKDVYMWEKKTHMEYVNTNNYVKKKRESQSFCLERSRRYWICRNSEMSGSLLPVIGQWGSGGGNRLAEF